MGFDGYYYRIKDIHDSQLFIDSSYDYDLRGLDKKEDIIKVPARQLAINNSMPTAGNIIMLGSFIKETHLISRESLAQAISKKIPKKGLSSSLKALKIGFEFG